MATRRVIKAVLENFLRTYVSRYSDCGGYWLFGLLVADLGELRVNLLGQAVRDPDTPMGVAVLSASARFEDQRRKAGLVAAQVREAWLTIRRMPELKQGSVNGHTCAGFNLRFSAEAVMDDGKRHERDQVVFVAPHDSKVELRSSRVI
jgi:hypothetical protein